MTVDELLDRARGQLNRVSPHEARVLCDEGAILVDIRPHADRLAEGVVLGAVVMERIVLEWRLDPSGEYRLPGLRTDTPVIIMCNEGYASSLAAAQALRLGLRYVTDVIGGFRAWKAAGLSVVSADSSMDE